MDSRPLPKDPYWAEVCLQLRAMSLLCREMTALYRECVRQDHLADEKHCHAQDQPSLPTDQLGDSHILDYEFKFVVHYGFPCFGDFPV